MPERKFRWAVGDPTGPQSPPWTLTVRGSGFILTARVPRQPWHVTFHESGERHWRFNSPAILARAGGPAIGRDAGVWQAPDAVGGVTTEFMLIVPTTGTRLSHQISDVFVCLNITHKNTVFILN